MDNPYGKPARSFKQFSRFKWGTAGLLLAALMLIWFSGAGRMADQPPGMSGARAGPEAGTSPLLAIDRAADGTLTVRGTVADEATRNQWLNAIRIGAQGARVADDLKVGATASSTAAGWTGQLSSLVALMRERKLSGLAVEGEKVLLRGAVSSQGDKADVERMIQAQLPEGYQLDSRLAVGGPAAGLAAASPSQSAPSPLSAPGAPAAAAPSAPQGPASDPSVPSTSSKQQAERPVGGSAAPGTDADAVGRNDARSDPRIDGRGQANQKPSQQPTQQPSKTPLKKQTDCPRQIRSLAKSVYFKTDAAALPAEDRDRLQRLGECLGRARVRIVGHADPRHTDEYNLELSERRARAVADALAAGGAPASRITVVAAGKTKASAKGATKDALQRARRVDIQIR